MIDLMLYLQCRHEPKALGKCLLLLLLLLLQDDKP
jgi:hypothetical protein